MTALADGGDVILVTVHEFLSSYVSYKLIYLLGVGSPDIAASVKRLLITRRCSAQHVGAAMGTGFQSPYPQKNLWEFSQNPHTYRTGEPCVFYFNAHFFCVSLYTVRLYCTVLHDVSKL